MFALLEWRCFRPATTEIETGPIPILLETAQLVQRDQLFTH